MEVELGSVWEYHPQPTADSKWQARAGHLCEVIDLKDVTYGEFRYRIRFLEPGDPNYEASGGVFRPERFDPASDNQTFHLVRNSEEESESVMKRIGDWALAEQIIPEARLVLLYGPPGTGKTTAGNRIGLRGGEVIDDKNENPGLLVSGVLKPTFSVFNISLTEETPAAELRGHYIMKGGEFLWQDGTGISPFRKGGRLILNEIDKASGDCLQFCHALLDDPEIARITLPTGETVQAHEDFSVVATMNGVPEDLPEALRDRFTVRINIRSPHPDAIKSLPEDLRAVCKKGYSGKKNAFDDRFISFRQWKTYGLLRESLGEEIASKAIFGERAENVLNTLRIETAARAEKRTVKTYVEIEATGETVVEYNEEEDEDLEF